MNLRLSNIKRIAELNLDPKDFRIVRIPFFPIDDPRLKLPFGSTAITPYIVELIWNPEINDWKSNLKL